MQRYFSNKYCRKHCIVYYTNKKQSNQDPSFLPDPRKASFLHPTPTQYLVISPLASTPDVKCVEFWCVECGVGCVVLGVWCLVCGMWCVM